MNVDIFETASVPRAVAKMVIPSITSMLVLILYNIADTFFVGQTGDANQVAAISLTIPVFMLFIAIGNIFGIGGSSVISRSIGRKDKARVARISSFCFYASIVSGLIMIALILVGMGAILRIIGTNEKTVGFARSYLTYIAIGAPFIVIPPTFGHIVRGEGAPKQAMIGMMVGTIVNIILDPIMILAMDMGVAGAAIATVIGNVVGFLYFVYYLVGKKTLLSIKMRYARISRHDALGIFGIGIPASLNNVLMSTAFILLNNVLNGYEDGEIYIAAMGVALRAGIFLIFTQLGFAMGIQALVGYCYGARNMERLKKIVWFSFICTTVVGIIATIVYALAADNIIKAFISDEAVVENGVKIMHALIVSYPVVGILFIITFSFQAMGIVGSSLLLNVSRQGLVFIPALYIFNATIGLDGVYYSQAVADYVSVFIAIVLFALAMKKATR
jgi:multidrug efflux pump